MPSLKTTCNPKAQTFFHGFAPGIYESKVSKPNIFATYILQVSAGTNKMYGSFIVLHTVPTSGISPVRSPSN